MSTPPPPQQPPPGPYGPPQPPSPYGGGQYPQQPFPQQYPPQPYPPQPFPQQPYPGQGPWGQPPMGPPPGRNRTGLVAGIVIGSVVVLGVLGFVVKQIADAGSVVSGSGFPAAEYRLTVPKTLLAGEFVLAQDLSDSEGGKAIKNSYDPKIRNPQPVVGQYTSTTAKGPGVLVVSGMYGQFKDPAGARRKMLAGAADADGASVAVPARDVTPPGFDITVSCEVLTSKQDGVTVTLPMCAWADGNTGASVAVVTPETSQQAPGSVDLAKVAETTAKVRAEARQPIG
ncbi:hypothetical protein ACFXB3_13835 [Streptomyces sp. NPDC059447]|uniref:hypothetical protein n=1 Tax=Streptomyces sp. NPDC059447 TaxID=3346834 RepID=UPI00368C83EA